MSDQKYMSWTMKTLYHLRLKRTAWAVRKYFVPVDNHALVLEVGSGGNPFPRSNILLDAYKTTRERHWVPLTTDRPTVMGFVENLPFKDNSFDYVIASHVLEHSKDPEKFISELERVARAGYIEVPDAFLERINPYKDHRLEITERSGCLKIKRKGSWVCDDDLVELYENRVKRILTSKLVPKCPFEFHVRYFWRGSISYVIENPEVDISWPAPGSVGVHEESGPLVRIKIILRGLLRKWFSQNRRNKNIDVVSILRCPQCTGDLVRHSAEAIHCPNCDSSFTTQGALFEMIK